MTALDVGALPILAAVTVGPTAARRPRRAGVWCTVMAWLFGIASLFLPSYWRRS